MPSMDFLSLLGDTMCISVYYPLCPMVSIGAPGLSGVPRVHDVHAYALGVSGVPDVYGVHTSSCCPWCP